MAGKHIMVPRTPRSERKLRLLDRMVGGGVVMLAVFAAGADLAHAQVTAYAGGSPSNIVLSIPVTASVGGRCGFAPGMAPNGSTNVGEVNNAFSADFPFTLECTVPFRAAVISQNGGLLASSVAPPSGYTNLAPYLVDLNLVGDVGVTPASATCDTGDLKTSSGATCTFKGPATASQGLRLNGSSYDVAGSYLRVRRAAYAGAQILAAANTYADSLTVTVTVSP
jgi:hypothetical protein